MNVAAVYDRRIFQSARGFLCRCLAAVIDRRYRGNGLGTAGRGLPALPQIPAVTDALPQFPQLPLI